MNVDGGFAGLCETRRFGKALGVPKTLFLDAMNDQLG